MSTQLEPILVDIRTAAEALSLSERYVRSLVAGGTLRHVRKGRRVLIPVAALHEYADNTGDAA